MGWVLGKSGTYPPIIGIWIPNLVMGGMGVFFSDQNCYGESGRYSQPEGFSETGWI